MHVSVDQNDGELTLHTSREGSISPLGHDLTLRLGSWSGEVDLDDEVLRSVRVVGAVRSLEVVRGDGGLLPLTAQDKDIIRNNALEHLRARIHAEVVFDAQAVHVTKGAHRVVGHASIAGVTKPLAVDVVLEREGQQLSLEASCAIKQSDFGITPFSGMLGALRVSDRVTIRAKLRMVPDGHGREAEDDTCSDS